MQRESNLQKKLMPPRYTRIVEVRMKRCMCEWNEAWRMASWVWSEGCEGVPSWEDGTGISVLEAGSRAKPDAEW